MKSTLPILIMVVIGCNRTVHDGKTVSESTSPVKDSQNGTSTSETDWDKFTSFITNEIPPSEWETVELYETVEFQLGNLVGCPEYLAEFVLGNQANDNGHRSVEEAGTERTRPELPCDSSQPEVGGGYHVPADAGRLGLPRGRSSICSVARLLVGQ